jgi:hypothetical protein
MGEFLMLWTRRLLFGIEVGGLLMLFLWFRIEVQKLEKPCNLSKDKQQHNHPLWRLGILVSKHVQ